MPSSRPTPRTLKRSTTNLSDLRLAPLSERYETPSPGRRSAPRTPREEAVEMTYARYHPSYVPGASAPATPGILSRSGSRSYLSGGLSRRGSLYDDAAVTSEGMGEEGLKGGFGGSGGMAKAKSEMALSSRLAGQGVPLRRPREAYASRRSRTGGTNTPRVRDFGTQEEDWYSRANAAANALLRESKGQAWIGESGVEESEDDEGYEEMAAASLAPERPKVHRWGSRYGSRSVSRRTSRRGSVAGRTPAATEEGGSEYFDSMSGAEPLDADFIRETREDVKGEAELEQLTRNRSMGFGGIVDRVVGFSLFGTAESEESGGETGTDTEVRDDGRRRKVLPPAAPAPAPTGQGEKVGIWEDAAWLLSVAGRALTQ